jgi:pullulanase/glycogen debranching enzyme
MAPHAGDEVLLTHNGNNNWYGHDQAWTHMDWELKQDQVRCGTGWLDLRGV